MAGSDSGPTMQRQLQNSKEHLQVLFRTGGVKIPVVVGGDTKDVEVDSLYSADMKNVNGVARVSGGKKYCGECDDSTDTRHYGWKAHTSADGDTWT